MTGTIRLRRVKREIGFIQDLHTLSPSPNISAANQLIGEVVQSRRRPLLGPSPS